MPLMASNFDMELTTMGEIYPDMHLRPSTSTSNFETGAPLPDNIETRASTTQLASAENGINSDEADTLQYVTGFSLHTLVLSLTMAAFLLMIDSTILTTVSPFLGPEILSNLTYLNQAIPKITSYFNSLKDIGWYGSAYLLAT